MQLNGGQLGPISRAWRLLATLLGIMTLLAAQFMHANDLFPLGALDQFAAGTDPDGEVTTACLQGQRGQETLDIPFGRDSVGVRRAEFENQLPAVQADPALLRPLAEAYDEAHPDLPPLDALTACEHVTHLRHGAPSGTEVVTLVRWERQG